MKKNVFLILFCFWLTQTRWIVIMLIAIWITGWDTGSGASRAKSELTSAKCEWTRIWKIKNVDETNLSLEEVWETNILKNLSLHWFLRGFNAHDFILCVRICKFCRNLWTDLYLFELAFFVKLLQSNALGLQRCSHCYFTRLKPKSKSPIFFAFQHW